MQPNHTETMNERGAAGLGHPDYPIYKEYVPEKGPEGPVTPSMEAERALGYVTVNEMVGE